MDTALTAGGEWIEAGHSQARKYSGSRYIALPEPALTTADLGVGDTVSLATQPAEIRAFCIEGWQQERRIREQGASVVLPVTKAILEAAALSSDAQPVAIEAQENGLRITPHASQEQMAEAEEEQREAAEQAVLSILDEYHHELGADMIAFQDLLREFEGGEDVLREALETLVRSGEVYAPDRGYYRHTSYSDGDSSV